MYIDHNKEYNCIILNLAAHTCTNTAHKIYDWEHSNSTKKKNKQTQKQHVNKKKHQYTPLLNKLR